jgi:pimeloyl-ACP methyl ester carboxylesterase
VKEYPVFIPSGDAVLSAIVTVPDHDPRGVVLLLPGGGGAPRSHRFAMWTRTARSLADRAIASVRMDWRGVGDSTGHARFSFRALPVEDAVAVARFAMRATGTERLGMSGNCGGARTVLQASAALPECQSMVLLLLKPLAGTRSAKPGVLKTKSTIRRVPGLGPLAKRLYWGVKWRRANPIMEKLLSVHRRSHVLLMESDTEKAGKLPRFVASRLGGNGTYRIEIRDLPGGTARAFQSLERQDYVVESVVEWFDRTLPGEGSARTTTSWPAATATRTPEGTPG